MIEDFGTEMIEIAEQHSKEERVYAIVRRGVSSVIVRRSETNRCCAKCNAHNRDDDKYPWQSTERISLVRGSFHQEEQHSRQQDIKMFLHAERPSVVPDSVP